MRGDGQSSADVRVSVASTCRRRGAPAGTREPERRRSEILEAAVRVLGLRGSYATSIDEIVAVAGISKGTFYHYFDSREALLLTVAERHFIAVEARVQKLFAQPCECRDQAARAFVTVVFGTKIPGLALCETVALVSRAAKSDSTLVSYSRLVEGFLQAGARSGLWTDGETRRNALFLAGGMLAIIGSYRSTLACDEEVIAIVAKQFTKALAPNDPVAAHNVKSA